MAAPADERERLVDGEGLSLLAPPFSAPPLLPLPRLRSGVLLVGTPRAFKLDDKVGAVVNDEPGDRIIRKRGSEASNSGRIADDSERVAHPDDDVGEAATSTRRRVDGSSGVVCERANCAVMDGVFAVREVVASEAGHTLTLSEN